LQFITYISANGVNNIGKYPADPAEVALPGRGGWSKEAVIGVAALIVMVLLPCLGVLWKKLSKDV